MEENITSERIANSISMDTSNRTPLLLEGKKDIKLFKNFISKKNVYLIPTFGCFNLIDVIDKLISRGFNNYLGIIDGDFHKILDTTPQKNNLLICDCHDIEIMMYNSPALNKIINIVDEKDETSEFEKKRNDKINNVVLNLASKIGYLKLANTKYQLGLTFKPKDPEGKTINYSNFITSELTFTKNEDMIQSIVNYSMNKSNPKKIDEIKTKLEEVTQGKYDLLQICNGHDVSNILYLFFKKKLKLNTKQLSDYRSIEDMFIMCYEFNYFQQTCLYSSILEWGKKNNINIF